MSKTMLIAFSVLSVYAFGYLFGVDYYKIFAVSAFIMALDIQLVAMLNARRRREMIELLEELNEENKDADESEREV